MESFYSLAVQEKRRIREANRLEHERRLTEVRRLIPEYTQIETRLAQLGAALARCVLTRTADVSEIERNVRALRAKREALLKQAGLPADYLEDIYTCPLCKDTGFEENGSRCACLQKLAADAASRHANLTEHMKAQTFDRFDFSLFAAQPAENGRQPLHYIKSAYEHGLRFAETFDTTHANLLLMGNAGTGKTFLSSCIANYALARGKTVYYQSAFSLFDMLEKLKFGRLDGAEQEQAETISRLLYEVDLLLIDDLGTEFISAYSTAALFNLVNTRQVRGKSTLLSTNLNSEGLEQIYSRRLTSRLWGEFEILPFIGQDLRLQRRTQTEKSERSGSDANRNSR